MPFAEWYEPKLLLRERDRGQGDMRSIKSMEEEFSHIRKGEEREAYLVRYPDGESLADLELRGRLFNMTLEREAVNEDAIVFGHSEVFEVFLVYYLSLSLEEFVRRLKSDNPHDKMHNGQIIHLTREMDGSDELTPYFNRFRSICPWDLSLSSNAWIPIEKKKYSNHDLLNLISVRT